MGSSKTFMPDDTCVYPQAGSNLYPARLLARSTPFQGVGTGSIPVQDANFLQKEQRHGGPTGVGTIKADKRLGYNSIRTDKFYSEKSKHGART